MLGKGMRAEIDHNGKTLYGIISNIQDKGVYRMVRMNIDNGGGAIRSMEKNFRLSAAPLPELVPCQFKKGDWVNYTVKGETHLGIVDKVTYKINRPFMKVFFEGGSSWVKAPASSFTPAAAPKADEPSEMDKWDITSYKRQHGHDDSIPFSAKITLNGKVVGSVFNDGWGGENSYNVQIDILERLRADVKEWHAKYGNPIFANFALDSWVDWASHGKKMGESAEMHLAGERGLTV
jgi:hypothetical protein